MLAIHAVYDKTDRIAIVKVPWWHNGYEWFVGKLCPCCGWRGRLFDKLGEKADEGTFSAKVYLTYHNIWSKIYLWPTKKEKVLCEIPVDNACEVALKVFKDNQPCHRDDCEACWHLRDDAMNVTQKPKKEKKWH